MKTFTGRVKETGNSFQASLLDKSTMTVTWELVPGRGAAEPAQEAVLAAAEQAAEGGRIHALTLTDNPGGNPAILPEALGVEILKMGIEPVIHFTCKDKNRNQIESQLYALDRAKIRNILVMTGDYPASGFQGRPKPVFDLDSVHTLDLITEMNEGLAVYGPKGVSRHAPADFFAGAAVSPFKAVESELLLQYYKLKKKIAKGARFVVTQLGYDVRKYHELVQFLDLNGLDVPLVGNIYVLPYGAAKIMNQNRIPGCVVTDKLVAELQEESRTPDKGVAGRMLRAAKLYAVLKGMGYSGVHLGGNNLSYEQVEHIIDKGEELSANWRDFVREFDYPQAGGVNYQPGVHAPGGFYYFEKDEQTGLNTDRPVNRAALPSEKEGGLGYAFMRGMHGLLFVPGKRLFPVMRGIYRKTEGKKRTVKALRALEHLTKTVMLDCKDCGDCAIFDIGYLCPMSKCPKNQRNGPCGGSSDGWCEVYPRQKKCLWVRAFARLKKRGEEATLEFPAVPPANWDLYQTSSWSNYFLGRDHLAERFKIEPPEKK